MTSEDAEFNGKFNRSRLKIQIEVKTGEKKKKNDIRKWKFAKYEENFTIWEEKIHSIRFQMTQKNAQFNGQFNRIRLKIQIEVKAREKKTFASEKLQNMNKISSFFERKFIQFDYKWQLQMHNSTLNSVEVD